MSAGHDLICVHKVSVWVPQTQMDCGLAGEALANQRMMGLLPLLRTCRKVPVMILYVLGAVTGHFNNLTIIQKQSVCYNPTILSSSTT